MKSTKFVAFLRGINVGGNKKVEMKRLKKSFEELGFQNVKTLLNSGNVIFETTESPVLLLSKIEKMLKETFGFPIDTILRSLEDLQTLKTTDPFKHINVTPETRLYVTFLSEKPHSKLAIPFETEDKNYKILKISPTEVISVVTITAQKGTLDAMAILEKEFGKKITTRNWNTIIKLLAL